MTGQTLWEFAVAQDGNKARNEIAERECTLLITGTKSAGKTTLINRYLEKEEDPKPSVALEYTYGRKTNKSSGKDVCHIYEVANGTLFLNLIKPTLEARWSSQSTSALAIIVDLSQPEEIWPFLEALHVSVLQSFLKDHSGLKVAILGSKYDLYQVFDANKLRMINRTLRYFGVLWQAAVLFYSNKNRVLLKQTKELLAHLTFNTNISLTLSTNSDGPLVVPFSTDSIQQLGGPMGDSDSRDVLASFDLWKQTYTTYFPPVHARGKIYDDPNSVKEPLIDALRVQKDEDLERFRQEMDRRFRQGK